jgi:hypothetical protein
MALIGNAFGGQSKPSSNAFAAKAVRKVAPAAGFGASAKRVAPSKQSAAPIRQGMPAYGASGAASAPGFTVPAPVVTPHPVRVLPGGAAQVPSEVSPEIMPGAYAPVQPIDHAAAARDYMQRQFGPDSGLIFDTPKPKMPDSVLVDRGGGPIDPGFGPVLHDPALDMAAAAQLAAKKAAAQKQAAAAAQNAALITALRGY